MGFEPANLCAKVRAKIWRKYAQTNTETGIKTT